VADFRSLNPAVYFATPKSLHAYPPCITLPVMSFEEALAVASRDEGFKATVYAMNTLLIHKGIYTQIEFQTLFVEWVEKEQKRKTPVARQTGTSSAVSA
jgi:hypothetical protein